MSIGLTDKQQAEYEYYEAKWEGEDIKAAEGRVLYYNEFACLTEADWHEINRLLKQYLRLGYMPN